MKTLLVIFGVTGDLSTRKLLPALAHIVEDQPTLDLSVLGVSRQNFELGELVRRVTGSAGLATISQGITLNVADRQDYNNLLTAIRAYAADQTLIYLAVPPGAAADIVDYLGEAGINTPDIRLLFEKPFGFDKQSASDFIQRTAVHFNESQLYRIDHYMAKEVAAEVLRRKMSSRHDYICDGTTISSVEVIASETVGIEGRSVFYEQTGALRDFIQGHLMQLLSLVLLDMTRPFALEKLPERRMEALSLLKAANPAVARRAQYEGYDEEAGNVGSRVETYADVRLESADPRWSGVPLRLVTGKSLDKKQSAIVLNYRDGTQAVLDEATMLPANKRLPDAYERVLIGAIHDERYLFTTSHEIIRSWEILASLQEAWQMETQPLYRYPTGSSVDMNDSTLYIV